MSFPLVGNPSEKKDSGQARMTEKGLFAEDSNIRGGYKR
jgi:hypothetical protein